MFKGSRLLATGLFTALLSFSSSLKAQQHPLVGVNYPPLPEKVDEKGGWVTQDPYVVDQVSINGLEFLLLSRIIKRDSTGKASYQVVNVLPLPPINIEIEEIAGGSSCMVNGKQAPNMIFIAKWEEDKPYLTKARKAWKVEAEKFVEINPQSVNFQCENFAYGL